MPLKIFSFLIIIGIAHQLCSAQENNMQITGKVINAKDEKPLVGASVYISNTTIGTVSLDSGSFRLSDIPPGKHDLVISYLGYKTLVIPINEQSNVHNMEILLYPEEKQLKEVVIEADTHWDEHYRIFLLSFMGRDKNASECKIINSNVLSFQYIDSTRTFSATADEPLVIVNEALGYKIYYQLASFTRKNNHVSYFGYSRFEPVVPRNNREERRWEKARALDYYGSFTHFMRSLLSHSLKADGFIVRKLVKSDDSLQRHPVSLRWTGEEFKATDTLVVSRSEWDKRNGFYILYPGNVPYDSIIRSPRSRSVYPRLGFTNSLYVIYTGRKGSLNFFWGYMPDKYRRAFPASILTMNIPTVPVNPDGSLVDPRAVTKEGYWATQRIADALPTNYHAKP